MYLHIKVTLIVTKRVKLTMKECLVCYEVNPICSHQVKFVTGL